LAYANVSNMKKYSLHMLKSFPLFLWLVGCSTTAPTTKANDAKLVILYVSDLHSQIVEDSTHGLGGYARLKTLVDQERANAGPKTDVLFVIGGDLLGKGRLPCRKTKERACAPLVKGLAPDLIAFGNGELKFSHQALSELAKQTGGVWLGSDVEPTNKSRPKFWKDSYMFDAPKSGLRMNFVSTTLFPGPGESVGGSKLEFVNGAPSGFQAKYQSLTTSALLPSMLIVHDDLKRLDELGEELCSLSTRPFLVLKAHEHRTDQGRRQCLKYVEPGAFGHKMARIEIGGSSEKPVVQDIKMIKVDESIAKNPQMESQINALYEREGKGARRIVAKVNSDLSQEKVGKFLALSYQRTSRADIAIVNSGAIKDGIAKGNLDWESVLAAIPYNNQLKGLDWSASDLERSLCQAAARNRDRRLDNGSDLIIYGAELRDAGKETCKLIVRGGKKVPKVVVDSYLEVRSARWLGRELKGKTFSYGLDTERALELGIQRYGTKEL
jgi:2',3'-cyclic-nucleotide 2'-phosphodiesterase (5'-nucleotidase family)